MAKIKYVVGDATNPIIKEKIVLLLHCVNDENKWGAGFVVALSNKWMKPEMSYRKWYKENTNPQSPYYNTFKLGMVQPVQVEDNIIVINMIGQNGIIGFNNPVPVDYQAIKKALNKIANNYDPNNYEIAAPRFGSARAGGIWSEIERIINETLIKKGFEVTIYDLPRK